MLKNFSKKLLEEVGLHLKVERRRVVIQGRPAEGAQQRPRPGPSRPETRQQGNSAESLGREIEDALEAHNAARREARMSGRVREQRQPLRWSYTLSRDAQLYAEEMARTEQWTHSPQAGRQNQGENLYRDSGGNRRVTFKDSVDFWNREKHAVLRPQEQGKSEFPFSGQTHLPRPHRHTPNISPEQTYGNTHQKTCVHLKAKTSTATKATDQQLPLRSLLENGFVESQGCLAWDEKGGDGKG
ncbi:hypothetical protein G7Y89_g14086 [Cudoniella acicularis]|uniref:Uncharacterized protein n=1 Tax=Cudoniella acicularis TaxID=354080 RepID=A0A8H4VVD8_9HELO|nr:hypothetical protein G7Y89_g14086 [Cudoniella acicularis]